MKEVKKILFVLDSADLAVDTAIRYCQHFSKAYNAQVTVVDVIKSIPMDWKDYLDAKLERDAQLAFKEKRENEISEFLKERNLHWPFKVIQGQAIIEISRLAKEGGFDLVVKPQAIDPVMYFASLDKQLVRKCPTAVLLVKPSQEKIKNVLVAIDPDPDNDTQTVLNRDVLQMGHLLSGIFESSLALVSAWFVFIEQYLRSSPLVKMSEEDFTELNADAENRYHNMLMKLGESIGLTFSEDDISLCKGPPEHVVPDVVMERKTDLLIMGSLGRTGVPGIFIGNTAEKILDTVECSVLALKPEAYETPLKLH